MIFPEITIWHGLLLLLVVAIAGVSSRKVFLAQPEMSRASRSFTILAYIVVVLSLAGLILQPRYKSEEGQLVTIHLPNAEPLATLPQGENISLGSNSLFPHIESVLSLKGVKSKYPDIKTLQLNGSDVPVIALSRINAGEIQVLQDTPDTGLSELHWPKQLFFGQTFTIAGRYQFHDSPLAELILENIAGDTLQSIRVKSGEAFQFQVIPKASGVVQYQIKLRSGELLADIRLFVKDGLQQSTYIWASSPGAELNSLKNWLLKQQQQVMTEYDISLSKTMIQQSHPEQSRESSALLVMDGRKLSRLNSAQLSLLTTQVESGKGLIILADTSLLDSAWMSLHGFKLQAHKQQEQQIRSLKLLDDNGPGYQFDGPVGLRNLSLIPTEQTSALIYDADGQALALKRTLGQGSIVLTLVAESFTLQRQQQTTEYSRYWQFLSAQALATDNQARLLELDENSIARVDHRLKVCALAMQQNLQVQVISTAEQYDIPLTASPQRPAMQCGFFWPVSSGWYQLKLSTGKQSQAEQAILDTSAVYIYERDAFQNMRAIQLQQAVAAINSDKQGKERAISAHYQPIPLYWFAILWLLGSAYIWWRKV